MAVMTNVIELDQLNDSPLEDLLGEINQEHDTRYKTLRKTQYDFLEFFDTAWVSDKKFMVANLPTGAGKSVNAAMISKMLPEDYRCFIVTSQNELVDQYIREFTGWNSLKGMSNYKCSIEDIDLKPKTCSDTIKASRIIARKNKDYVPSCEGLCEYKTKRRKIASSKVTVFNIHSYYYQRLTSNICADVLIVDEFHSLPNALRDMFSVTIPLLNYGGVVKLPPGLKSQTIPCMKAIEHIANYIEAGIEDDDDEIARLKKIIPTIENSPMDFIAEYADIPGNKTGLMVRVRPVKVLDTVLGKLFNGFKKVLLMSGTSFVDIKELLGKESYDYFEAESTIPVENRLFFPLNAYDGSYKARTPGMWKNISEIITKIIDAKHSGQNGIVHCTYAISKELSKYLDDRFICYDSSSRQKAIHEFKSSKDQVILVGSAIYEGLDLKDDLSRFTFFTTIPYADYSDVVVKARITRYPDWYGLESLKNIIQGAGRSTRSDTDFSTSYFLDSRFWSLYQKNAHLLPYYFTESVQKPCSLSDIIK
jgi:Rad3-related DNA helicase